MYAPAVSREMAGVRVRDSISKLVGRIILKNRQNI